MAPGRLVRCGRAVRRLALGGGALARPSDRVQAAARCVVAVLVALAPVPATVVVATTTARLQQTVAEQQAERHRVTAVLLEDAEPSEGAGRVEDAGQAGAGAPDHGTSATLVPVRAAWRTATGTREVVTAFVAPGTRRGSGVQVWLAAEGRAVAAPLSRGDVSGRAVLSGVLVLLAVPLAALGAYGALVRVLDAHRARRWAAEWAVVGPRWTARLR
ncbi:Rv1733c family protein [Blastococcus sp. SYSU D00695]